MGERITTDLDSMLRPVAASDVVGAPAWSVSGSDWFRDFGPPPDPIAWRLDEGGGLLFPERRVQVVAEGGQGKSMLALAAAIEVVNDGGVAVVLDWERTFAQWAKRARVLRVGPTEAALSQEAADRLHYVPMVGRTFDADAMPDRCTFVAVDSVPRAIAARGGDENAAADFTRFIADVSDPIRARFPLAGQLFIHHPGHGDKNRARGSSAQRPVFDVDLSLTNRGAHQMLKLQKANDDFPDTAANHPLARVTWYADGESLALHLQQVTDSYTDDGHVRPTVLMERSSRYMEKVGEPHALRVIRSNVTGNNDAIGRGLRILVDEGHAEQTADGYRSLKPYREATDPRRERDQP
jgi:hypothetical protein